MLESLADTRRRRARQAANRRAAMRPSAFFEKLPPEIRLMIFDFAYGTDAESIKVNLTRTESVNGNALKCAFDPIIGISKQWFIESFDRNVRSTRFAFEKFDAIEDLLRRLPSIKKSITSVSWRVKHEFEIGRQMVSLCKSAPNIKAIHVYATDYIYGDHLLDPRFRSLYEELLNLRGLDSFQLTTDEDLSWASEKFRSKCEDGARHFVDTVVKHVTKAKGVS